MVIIPINSGVFVNERGTSSTFLSLLTEQDALSSLGQPGYTKHAVGRMIGGSSFMDRIHSVVRNIGQFAHRVAPMAKNMLASTGNPYASAAATALGSGSCDHRGAARAAASYTYPNAPSAVAAAEAYGLPVDANIFLAMGAKRCAA